MGVRGLALGVNWETTYNFPQNGYDPSIVKTIQMACKKQTWLPTTQALTKPAGWLGPLALTTRVSCIVTWPLVPGTSWLHCPPVQHIFPLLLRLLYREFLFGRLSRYGWSKSPEGTDPKIRKRAGQLSELYTKVLRSAVDLEEILCPVRHRVLKWKFRKNYFSKIVFLSIGWNNLSGIK